MEREPAKATICRYLRARNPYGMNEGGDNPWYLLDDSNTMCWCIKAIGGVGPDNGAVDPRKCREGRKCFRQPNQR